MTSMGELNSTLLTMWFLQSFPVVAKISKNRKMVNISLISKDKVGCDIISCLFLFVEMTKFNSYLSSYHPMQKASNCKSGLNMER